MSVERESKILAELILGEEVEAKLAAQALDRLKLRAELSEHFKEALVAALDALTLHGGDIPLPYPEPVLSAIVILGNALNEEAEEVLRSIGEIANANLASEIETVREREEIADGVHTIPVPEGWSVEQAWEAISRGEGLPAEEVRWANVLVEEGKMTRTYRPDE